MNSAVLTALLSALLSVLLAVLAGPLAEVMGACPRAVCRACIVRCCSCLRLKSTASMRLAICRSEDLAFKVSVYHCPHAHALMPV